MLSGIDIDYEVRAVSDINESYPDNLPNEEVAEFLARKKADAYFKSLVENDLLITADTIVLLENKILGKPLNKEDAKNMLRELSGQTHLVITGVCLTSKQKQVSFSDKTRVTFGDLTDQEIEYYVEKYNPLDKAEIRCAGMDWLRWGGKIVGSYFNVMGLPIFKLYRELKQF